jgi:ABC-2 type transport system permease protein
MSSTETISATEAVAPPAARAPVVRPALRLFVSELSMVFRRRRTLAMLVLLVLLPVLVGLAVRFGSNDGNGPPVMQRITHNGMFLDLLAFTFLTTLVLPLTVAIVSGDSIAGEANLGTLRYLLTVPAGRTRLLLVKFTAMITYCLAACLAVTVGSLAAGAAMFPIGAMTTLSGTTISFWSGLLRLVLVALYVAAGLVALGAIGTAFSTFTEHPIGAIAAAAIVAVGSEVMDLVPQLHAIQPYLLTHYWEAFDGLLRYPMDGSAIWRGLVCDLVYVALFGSVAWARFTSSDITA